MEVAIPPETATEIRGLVAAAVYADEPSAVVELVRLGLRARERAMSEPSGSHVPPERPGRHDPRLAGDVNWFAP